jgi:hypothetical protein
LQWCVRCGAPLLPLVARFTEALRHGGRRTYGKPLVRREFDLDEASGEFFLQLFPA